MATLISLVLVGQNITKLYNLKNESIIYVTAKHFVPCQ